MSEFETTSEPTEQKKAESAAGERQELILGLIRGNNLDILKTPGINHQGLAMEVIERGNGDAVFQILEKTDQDLDERKIVIALSQHGVEISDEHVSLFKSLDPQEIFRLAKEHFNYRFGRRRRPK